MSSQTNTQPGAIVIASGENLSGKEGYLAEIRSNSGVANAYLPDAITDYAFYLITDGGNVSGDNVTLRPLEASRNHRIVLKGACVPGDVLVLADPSTSADKGKLRKLPATTGTYRGLAIAEETGVDGQLVLVRPAPIGNVTVS
jgi:hypothetical protein